MTSDARLPVRRRIRVGVRRTFSALVLSGLVVVGSAACASDGDGSTGAPSTTSTTLPPEDAATLEVAATLDGAAMAMAVRPGDEDAVYLAIRRGTVVRAVLGSEGSPGEVSDPVLDFADDVSQGPEQGLLGIAFSPDGSRLYTSYNDQTGDSVLDEYEVSGRRANATVDPSTRREVLRVERDPDSFHNGGNIVFGPDGYLYYALGEGGGLQAGVDNGQDPTTLLGKILRIDPTAATRPYAVPDDNPLVGTGGGNRPEVWLWGVRNPWRYSFDRATGDLWVADVGEQRIEEVDFLPADADGGNAGRGANLGWAEMEGNRPFEGGQEPADHTPPIFTYRHADGGCAVIGGYVYRGEAVPELDGTYLYVDRCRQRLAGLRQAFGQVSEELDLGATPERTNSLGEDADGEVYLLQQSGDVLRVTGTGP